MQNPWSRGTVRFNKFYFLPSIWNVSLFHLQNYLLNANEGEQLKDADHICNVVLLRHYSGWRWQFKIDPMKERDLYNVHWGEMLEWQRSGGKKVVAAMTVPPSKANAVSILKSQGCKRNWTQRKCFEELVNLWLRASPTNRERVATV